ncbi:sigma-70 family RNA polymerase sigma factor [Clostridium sp. MSJ-11]|uniref:Sigma-70 family RNA polymerase sigma factor n=1 Tax=Clostridium mobile TaxID=2841512 RepID=A0ABS6EFX1_9CLOT|nr:sigma-70 family RNA polymerase sigma factor [Clostridium mobile]MBU5484047.1 sigma-70 family RNA polymerase sigma factor [Clostridium mobile]
MRLVKIFNKTIDGDKENFNILIQNRKENIYKIAYSYVNNVDDALDIVQDVIYKALTSIDTLKNPQYFNTWLTRITINCSINHLRKSKKVVYMDESNIEGVDTNLNNREEIMDLRRELEKLDVKYKTVIILKYFEDMTLNEISQVLNLPISTVKTHLYRALEKLKINLKEADLDE